MQVGDAALFEGQRVVTEGFAMPLAQDSGHARFDLTSSGSTLRVQASEEATGWVEVEGRIARRGGHLVLYAERVVPEPTPDLPRVTVAALAGDPDAWAQRAVLVEGQVDKGELADGQGHRLRLADGEWPRGPAQGPGILRYAPACVCYVLNPAGPWTPY